MYKNELKNNDNINKLSIANIRSRKFKMFFSINNIYKKKLK